MADRCIFPDYKLRGAEFEVWVDGGPDTWWLCARTTADAHACGVPAATVLTGDEFDPPLTVAETDDIYDKVCGWYDRWDGE